jgi:ankyrin repeat protein
MALLQFAVQNDLTNTALCLLREGNQFTVNEIDRKGNTPLHYAVKKKNLPVIKALLNAGKGKDDVILYHGGGRETVKSNTSFNITLS